MKNVYFVQANDVYGTDKKSTYIPYAVGCIMAYCLKNETIASSYSFGKIIYSRDNTDKVAAGFSDPFMVLFSSSVWNMEYNKVLAQKIKARYPQCLIVFGGHNISPDGSDLEKYSYIDFLTHRFGEEPTEGILEALALGKDLKNVPNISYRDKDGNVITTAYAPQTGTDYPSPYLEGIFDEILKDDISFSGLFESNRGCPNSCSFCDWSSLKDKVRLFPMERVFAEIDWFVKNKIEYIYCTDGNFCLFDRDAEIANYVVSCKEKYGYPQIFKVFFTKNRFNFVFDVSTRFFRSGLDKAKTISFQSLNPEVLRNVGRRNISTEMFKDLMKKYNDLNIATFSELILGLPGETKESFCKGMCRLLENGQHNSLSVYHCEALPNSDLTEPSYVEKHKIEIIKVAFNHIHSAAKKDEEVKEYSYLVRSTATLSREDWVYANLFSVCLQCFHSLGILRYLAMYFSETKKSTYYDFYTSLLSFIMNTGGKLNKLWTDFKVKYETSLAGDWNYYNESFGDVTWFFEEGAFIEIISNFDEYMSELTEFIDSYNLDKDFQKELLSFQKFMLRKPFETAKEASFNYDFYSFFESITKGNPATLQKKSTSLTVTPKTVYDNIASFAKETVWFGRRRGATVYSKTEATIN